MIKAQYFVLVAALVTGTVLGLVDIFHFDKKVESSDERGKSSFFLQSAPRFEGTQAKRDITQISPTFANMGVLIPQYASMSVEELSVEIKRLHVLSQKEGASHEDGINLLIQFLVMKLGSDFPGEVRPFLDNGLVDTSLDYSVPLLEGWVSSDFDGAMEYLLANKDKWLFSSSIFSRMLRSLAEENPDKAMEWMLSQTGQVRKKALSEMVDVLEEKHPAKMGEWIGKLLPEDLKKDYLLDSVAKSWGSCDWESAMRWADTLSDIQKNRAVIGILGGLGASDLEKATEEYKKQPKELQRTIARVIVECLSQKDDMFFSDERNGCRGKKQAFEWLLDNRSEIENSGEIARDMATSSALLTPEFTSYVQKMPEGDIRDNILRGMSNMTALNVEYGNHTYEEAFALADQIKDPAIQMESKLSNIRNWVDDDPEAARVWIDEKSGFSEEEKQEQLKACEESMERLKKKGSYLEK